MPHPTDFEKDNDFANESFVLTGLDYAEIITNGDQLRNTNSYEYLKLIADAVFPEKDKSLGTPEPDSAVAMLRAFQEENKSGYDPDKRYGDLYTKFLLTLEKECEKYQRKENPTLDAIVRAAFENKNNALERTATMTKRALEEAKHKSNDVEKSITKRLKMSPTSTNALSPEQADSFAFKTGPMASAMAINETKATSRFGEWIRGKARTGIYDFKPMSTTSQISIRRYNHQTADSPTELRMGTQAQYHQGQARINPIFERRIEAQAKEREEKTATKRNELEKKKTELKELLEAIPKKEIELKEMLAAEEMPIGQAEEHLKSEIEKLKNDVSKLQSDIATLKAAIPISHVYFNNLGQDHGGLSYKGKLERGFEYNLTQALHTAELNNPNLAIITLPADKGFLDKKLLTSKKTESCQDAFSKFLAVANGTSKEPIQDFYISEKVQKLLYGTDERGYVDERNRNQKLEALLRLSFKKVLGVDDPRQSKSQFTAAELQAVYFHFIKFELTNFILETLQPDTFNTSCKDGIDRGGVSSAYYNLIKSIEKGTPLDKDEFYRALHAAPTLVKGRGMNHHTQLIWNAVDKYLAGNDKRPDSDPDKKQMPDWLIEWRNKNVPGKMEATVLSDRWTAATGVASVSKATTPTININDTAFSQVAQFSKTLYTPEKTEPSSFYRDLSRNKPSFGGKQFPVESLSEGDRESLSPSEFAQETIKTFVRDNLIIPKTEPPQTVSDKTVDALVTCFNQVLRDPIAPTVFSLDTKGAIERAKEGIFADKMSYTAFNPNESFSVTENGEVILKVTMQQKIVSAELNRELDLGEITYEYKLNEGTSPPSFELTGLTCENDVLKSALAFPDDQTHFGELLHALLKEGKPLSIEVGGKDHLTEDERRQHNITTYIDTCRKLHITINLSDIDCRGVNFNKLDLSGVSFQGANLSGANLTGANLTGANLTGANMGGANLSGAILTGVTFTNTNLNDITFDRNTVWKGIKEFKNVACAHFHIGSPEESLSTAKTYESRDFIKTFKKEYAPPHRLTFLAGPKDTQVTRFINDLENSNGSKLVYLLSHAEEKTRYLDKDNNTRLAIDKVISGDDPRPTERSSLTV